MTLIDLASDAQNPTHASMRAAMAAAEVGDDVFDEDPTVHRLVEHVAELLDKPARCSCRPARWEPIGSAPLPGARKFFATRLHITVSRRRPGPLFGMRSRRW